MRLLLAVFIFSMSPVLFAQTPPPAAVGPGVSQELARWRAARYSDVRYKLNLTLEKMSPVLKGTIEVRVNLKSSPPYEGGVAEGRGGSLLVLDWRKVRGYEERSTISNVSINGQPTSPARSGENHPVAEAATPLLRKEGSLLAYREENEHLIFRDGVVEGENVIKLDFTSPILTSGSAITRYVDKEDGSEYIYSLFVPSDASTAFPVFDQPDLKARFQFNINTPESWRVVTNSGIEKHTRYDLPDCVNCGEDRNIDTYSETKPISTYVFAFAAGPWEKVGPDGTVRAELKNTIKKWANNDVSILMSGLDPTGGNLSGSEGAQPGASDSHTLPTGRVSASDAALSTSIYIRKSQAGKFKPHAPEVFRLNREALKYFEQYFDYKFPFPKYDLVLIPEFPFGGMEHAGATFLRESSIIFPQEPTKNDLVSRATLIFHEAAHQWFGDTVTMRWFDDLWLKEGFATFTAYKALEKIMPEMNSWKVFYERIKQGAYQTDSTRGTTAIYQPIANLSAAKSAYGNIVYNKAPAFLRQAEFYLGEDKFQTAVRAFLKKHEFGNAGWEDLVTEFETTSKQDLIEWANIWVKRPGVFSVRMSVLIALNLQPYYLVAHVRDRANDRVMLMMKFETMVVDEKGGQLRKDFLITPRIDPQTNEYRDKDSVTLNEIPVFVFPNVNDYGYGIFLLDEKSRDHVLKNIQNEKDPFLRTMMWGALWDSVREGELDPRVFVELVVKVLGKSYAFTREPNAAPAQRGFTPEGVTLTEEDESTIATLLGRTGTALNYYMSEPGAVATGLPSAGGVKRPIATAPGSDKNDLRTRVEEMLIERMGNAPTLGQRITYYRALLNIAASEEARGILKTLLVKGEPPPSGGGRSVGVGSSNRPPANAGGSPLNRPPANAGGSPLPLKTKDKFDIITRLLILGDPEALRLLADLEKTETSDDAKRYAYAARAGIGTVENKAKYWNDFVSNKEISESWIEAAFGPWNAIKHNEITSPYLQRALQELPNHKRNRKIFFVNGWLGAFIGGQRSAEALAIVNKFLADNPGLDNDLRLKVLENADLIERAVRIRGKY